MTVRFGLPLSVGLPGLVIPDAWANGWAALTAGARMLGGSGLASRDAVEWTVELGVDDEIVLLETGGFDVALAASILVSARLSGAGIAAAAHGPAIVLRSQGLLRAAEWNEDNTRLLPLDEPAELRVVLGEVQLDGTGFSITEWLTLTTPAPWVIGQTGIGLVFAELALGPGDSGGLALKGTGIRVIIAPPGTDWRIEIDATSFTWDRDGVDLDAFAIFDPPLELTLGGVALRVAEATVRLADSALVTASVRGELELPFLDRPVAISVELGDDGVGVTAEGVIPFEICDGVTATIGRLGLVVRDGTPVLSFDVAFSIRIDEDAEPITITVLGVTEVDGKISVDMVEISPVISCKVAGFAAEITAARIGTAADGRRYIGLDGGLRLGDIVPSAAFQNLQFLWLPSSSGALPELDVRLEGVSVDLVVAGVLTAHGLVALTTDPQTGRRAFAGEASLRLDALEAGVDARLMFGTSVDNGVAYDFVYVSLAVDICIPIGQTSTAIYGFSGVFGANVAPNREGSDWYGWFVADPAYDVVSTTKWRPERGAWAFGAGITVGTLLDAGYALNVEALLIVLAPGPTVLLQGKAAILDPPKPIGERGASTLEALAVLDGGAGTFDVALDAQWGIPKVIDIAGSGSAHFDFTDLDAWYLHLGEPPPSTRAIRADVYGLLHGEAWFAIDGTGVATGASARAGGSWTYGPVKLTMSAGVAATGALTWRPMQVAGTLGWDAALVLSVGPLELGIAVMAELSGTSSTPFSVKGALRVIVALPAPFKDFEATVELEWTSPGTPEPVAPFASAGIELARSTSSWDLVAGPAATRPDSTWPSIPLAAWPVLQFARPVIDRSGCTANPPATIAEDRVGAYTFAYELASLRLERWVLQSPEPAWEDVPLSGTWSEEVRAGTQLFLLADTPFERSRCTSSALQDHWQEAHPSGPPADVGAIAETQIDWSQVAVKSVFPPAFVYEGVWFDSSVPSSVDVNHALTWSVADGDTIWIAPPVRARSVRVRFRDAINGISVQPYKDGQPLGAPVTHAGPAGDVTVTGSGIEWVGITVRGRIGLVEIAWVDETAASVVDTTAAAVAALDLAATRWAPGRTYLATECAWQLVAETRTTVTHGDTTTTTSDTVALGFQTSGLTDLSAYLARVEPVVAGVTCASCDVRVELEVPWLPDVATALAVQLTDESGRVVVDADASFTNNAVPILARAAAGWSAALGRSGRVVDAAPSTVVCAVAPVPASAVGTLTATLVGGWTRYIDRFDAGARSEWSATAVGGGVAPALELSSAELRVAAPMGARGRRGATAAVLAVARATDGAIALTAVADGAGEVGAIARWVSAGDHLALRIGAGGARLVRAGAGEDETLWSDPAMSRAPGVAVSLVLRVEGTAVAAAIDGVWVAAATVDAATTAGAFGVVSGVQDGARFRAITVTSARVPLVTWSYTVDAAIDPLADLDVVERPAVREVGVGPELAAVIDAGLATVTTAVDTLAVARSALAAASPGDVVAERERVDAALVARDAAMSSAHDAIAAALAIVWTPWPVGARITSLDSAGITYGWYIELAHALDVDRATTTVSGATIVWSKDRTRALIVRAGAAAFADATVELDIDYDGTRAPERLDATRDGQPIRSERRIGLR